MIGLTRQIDFTSKINLTLNIIVQKKGVMSIDKINKDMITKNYQELYCELSRHLGYDCTKVVIPVEMRNHTPYKHTWAIISSNEGYCNLDMTSINCLTYK